MSLTHLLTPAADLRHVRVACGTATPDRATWLLAMVTCARCKATRGPVSQQGPALEHHPVTTEKALQEEIRQMALAGQWLYYHTHDARKSPAGFPDTVCVRGPRLLLAELKRPGKTPTAAQQQWLEALGQVTGPPETYVWTPADLAQALEVLR